MLYSPHVERNIIKKALKKQKKMQNQKLLLATGDLTHSKSFGPVDFLVHSSLEDWDATFSTRLNESADFGDPSVNQTFAHELFLNAQVGEADVCMSVDTHSRFCKMSATVMDYLDLGDQLEDTFDIIDSGNTLGEILEVPVSVNSFEMKLNFLVTDEQHDHIVLGLNELRKHECIIDLANNHIKFGGKDGEQVQFLKENEIRKVKSHLDLKNLELGFGRACA